MKILAKEPPDFLELMEVLIERNERHNLKCLRFIKKNKNKTNQVEFKRLVQQANSNIYHADRLRAIWLEGRSFFEAVKSLDVLYLCTGHLVRSCEEAGISVPFSHFE